MQKSASDEFVAPGLPYEPLGADEQVKGMYATALKVHEERVQEPTYAKYLAEGLEWKTVGDFAVADKNTYYTYAAFVYQEAAQQKPTEWVPWFNMGNMFSLSGEWERAEQAYKKAAELAPDRYEPLLGLLDALQASKRVPTRDIITYFNQQFPKLKSDQGTFVLHYARYLLENSENKDALSVLKVAAQMFPGDTRLQKEYEAVGKELKRLGL